MELENLAYVIFFIIYIVYQVFFKRRSGEQAKAPKNPPPQRRDSEPQPRPQAQPKSKHPESIEEIFREILEKNQTGTQEVAEKPETPVVESIEPNPYMDYLDTIPAEEGQHSIKRKVQHEVKHVDKGGRNRVKFDLKQAVIYDTIMNRPYS